MDEIGIYPLYYIIEKDESVSDFVKRVVDSIEKNDLNSILIGTDTEKLVNIDIEKIKNKDYREKIEYLTNEVNKICINDYENIYGDSSNDLFELFKKTVENKEKNNKEYVIIIDDSITLTTNGYTSENVNFMFAEYNSIKFLNDEKKQNERANDSNNSDINENAIINLNNLEKIINLAKASALYDEEVKNIETEISKEKKLWLENYNKEKKMVFSNDSLNEELAEIKKIENQLAEENKKFEEFISEKIMESEVEGPKHKAELEKRNNAEIKLKKLKSINASKEEILAAEEELENAKWGVDAYDKYFEYYENETKEYKSNIAKLNQEIASLKNKMKSKIINKLNFEKKYGKDISKIYDKNDKIVALEREFYEKRKIQSEKIESLENIEKEIKEKINNDKIDDAKKQIEELSKMISDDIKKLSNNKKLNEKISELEKRLADANIESKATNVTFEEIDIKKLRKELQKLDTEKEELDKKIIDIKSNVQKVEKSKIEIQQMLLSINEIIESNRYTKDEIDKKISEITKISQNSILPKDLEELDSIEKREKEILEEIKNINEKIKELEAKVATINNDNSKDETKTLKISQELDKLKYVYKVLDGQTIEEIEKSIIITEIQKNSSEDNKEVNDKAVSNEKLIDKIPNEKLEEVKKFKDAPKSLTEKTQKKSFIKKAGIAIATLAVAALTLIFSGKNKLSSNDTLVNNQPIIETSAEEQNEEPIEDVKDDEKNKENEENDNNLDENTPAQTLEQAVLESIKNASSIYSAASDALNSNNEKDAYKPSWEQAFVDGSGAIAGYYTSEGYVDYETAQKALENGEPVSALVNNDDTPIGFVGIRK